MIETFDEIFNRKDPDYYRLISDGSIWSIADAVFVTPAQVVDEAAVIDLPNLEELRVCLRFYGYPLGELVEPKDRMTEIKAELDRLDLASIRPLRAIENGTDSTEDHARLVEIRQRVEALRAELRKLEAAE